MFELADTDDEENILNTSKGRKRIDCRQLQKKRVKKTTRTLKLLLMEQIAIGSIPV